MPETHLQPEPAEPHTWKLTLAYDGTDYKGWQVQPGEATIQGQLQDALGRVTGESPLPQGSGRTDAGVHALAQVASFELRANIPEDNLLRALNRTLSAAIRVIEAKRMPAGFHARHSTVAKTYEYRVFPEKPMMGSGDGSRTRICAPFLARYVCAYPWPLDFEVLEQAAAAFVGTHDFLSFAATDPDVAARSGKSPTVAPEEEVGEEDVRVTAVRTVLASNWEKREAEGGTSLIYRVRGSGFLHHMVRNLVGTMLDVGRGYRRVDEIPAMIAARARAAAGPTAPARGLFLHSVEYEREFLH